MISCLKHKRELVEIIVSNKLITLTLILFLNHCSFNKNSNFWSNIDVKEDKNKKELFKKVEVASFEVNKDLDINIDTVKFTKNNLENNLTNNYGRLNFNGKLKKAKKYSFKKIPKFDEFEPEIVFDKENVIFFSNKGNILKFDNNSKLLWKKNYYTKEERKLKPILFLSKGKKTLIVADSIAKIFALDIETGDLLWSKNNSSAFNSEIKVYKDQFFLIDYENVLRSFSIKDGKENWKMKTDNSLLKSQKKLSIVIKDKKIFFNNSIGDVMAADIDSGNLLWIVPTLRKTNYSSNYFLKMSNLLAHKDSIYFSTNMNEFYSIDINSGLINWTQDINSSLRSSIVNDKIFSVSNEGFFNIINAKNGTVIRRTDLFFKMKKIKKKKVKPTGFIVGKNNIYTSLDNGRILITEIKNGKTLSSLKIANDYISRPFILNENLFVIKKNGIIKIE
jgi:outer membrane protein assembly factor BamB